MRRRARERAPEAEAALSLATRAPVAREVVDAPRLGLSRAEALDLLLERAQEEGASAAYARILRGGADVFGRVAVENVSVGLILEASGVSRRTFYQFFEGKAQVLDALLAIITSIWLADARKAFAASPERSALAHVLVRAYRLAGFLLRTLFAEASKPGSPLAARRDALLVALTEETLARCALPASRRARTRAEIVSMIAIIEDAGIDPDSTVHASRAVTSLLETLFAAP